MLKVYRMCEVLSLYILFLLGGWDRQLQYLLIAISIDFTFGIFAAIYKRQFHYDIGLRGILKKVGILGGVALAFLIEQLIDKPGTIRSLVCYAFTLNESFSIMKNLKILGVPIPDFFYKKVEELVKEEGVDNEGER